MESDKDLDNYLEHASFAALYPTHLCNAVIIYKSVIINLGLKPAIEFLHLRRELFRYAQDQRDNAAQLFEELENISLILNRSKLSRCFLLYPEKQIKKMLPYLMGQLKPSPCGEALLIKCKELPDDLDKSAEAEKLKIKFLRSAYAVMFVYKLKTTDSYHDFCVKPVPAGMTVKHISDQVKVFSKHCDKCMKTSERLKVCNSCKMARYCTVECQREDWKRHKDFCRGYRIIPQEDFDR
jgi:hypothetical protein